MRNTILALGGAVIVVALGFTTDALIPVMASNAQADSFHAKPGAWEMTFTTTTAGSLVPADVLAKMPPEQRAKFEQAMKARSAKPTTHVSKECLTQEDLDQNRMIKDDDDDEGSQCTTKVASKSPSKLVFEKSCASPRPSTAQAKFTLKSKAAGSAPTAQRSTLTIKLSTLPVQICPRELWNERCRKSFSQGNADWLKGSPPLHRSRSTKRTGCHLPCRGRSKGVRNHCSQCAFV
jgi:hypothetical protein